MRQRLNAAFPSLVLIVVACTQIWRAKNLNQSPWKGGGFGMFATSDTPGTRFFRISLVSATGEVRVGLPKDMAPQGSMLRTVPTEDNARDVARRLSGMTWVQDDLGAPVRPGAVKAPDASLPGEAQDDTDDNAKQQQVYYRNLERDEPEPAKEKILVFDRVRVEVWRYSFDTSRNVARAARIQSVEVSRPDR